MPTSNDKKFKLGHYPLEDQSKQNRKGAKIRTLHALFEAYAPACCSAMSPMTGSLNICPW